MQIADCSQQQQDHKICYKNFLHKTPGTKTQQNPKNSKQSATQREREREREERRRIEKKLQIWEMKLPSSLPLCSSPPEQKTREKALPFPFSLGFLVLFLFAFVDFGFVFAFLL
jgi:hypothetical protein